MLKLYALFTTCCVMDLIHVRVLWSVIHCIFISYVNANVSSGQCLHYLEVHSGFVVFSLAVTVCRNIYFAFIIVCCFYFIPCRGVKYCDQHVCMFVCPPTCLKNDKWTSPNCLYMLPMAFAQSGSDGSAICYVHLVLWMMSCFHIMEPMEQNQRWCCLVVKFTIWQHHLDIRRCYVWLSNEFIGWQHWNEVCCLQLPGLSCRKLLKYV